MGEKAKRRKGEKGKKKHGLFYFPFSFTVLLIAGLLASLIFWAPHLTAAPKGKAGTEPAYKTTPEPSGKSAAEPSGKAAPEPGKPPAGPPAKVAVDITDKSKDPIGKMLVQELRGMVLRANNLRLAVGSEPRIGMIILTVDPKTDPEYKESLFNIVWVSFHRIGPGIFQPLFLNTKVGVCREDQVKSVAEKAMEDTQRVIGELYKSLQDRR